MQPFRIVMVAGLALFSAAFAPGQTDQAEQPDPAARENAERAMQILRDACQHLAAARSVRITSHGSYDQISPEGIRMELSGRRITTLQRPDRLHIDTSGDVVDRVVVFDRGRLGVLARSERIYATKQLPSTLDAAIDQLATEYGLVLPTADLLLSDPYAALTGAVELAAYLGEHRAADRICHHLAFQTPNVDFQVWVDRQQPPVLRKLVVTYKNEPGVPQFRTTFDEWAFDLDPPEDLFRLEVPPGYSEVDLEPEAGAAGNDATEDQGDRS